MNKHKTLDEIKEKYTNPPIAEKIDGIDYALIDLADLEWLIKQVERVQELEHQYERYQRSLAYLRNTKNIMTAVNKNSYTSRRTGVIDGLSFALGELEGLEGEE